MLIDYLNILNKLIPIQDHLTSKRKRQYVKLSEWVTLHQARMEGIMG
jgi:hypothetical protein